jgi:hypothetical protein
MPGHRRPHALLKSGVAEVWGRIADWLWEVQGLSCREATQLSSRALDAPLTRRERAALFLHNVLCIYCWNYARQLRFLRRHARRIDFHASPGAKLPSSSVQRIKAALLERKEDGIPPDQEP